MTSADRQLARARRAWLTAVPARVKCEKWHAAETAKLDAKLNGVEDRERMAFAAYGRAQVAADRAKAEESKRQGVGPKTATTTPTKGI